MPPPRPARPQSDDLVRDPQGGVARLREIMRRLRDPDDGCPWDIRQDFASIAPYTIEEAYEVADAIERGDRGDLCDELGDLLLQVVYHAQMAEEADDFTFDDVIRAISNKMLRRHPHVFAPEGAEPVPAESVDWEAVKAAEKTGKSATTGAREASVLNGVPLALPALTRAIKLQNRAARVGFDWPETTQVLDKLSEEAAELVEAREQASAREQMEEFGDLAFVMANLARHLSIDPEAALRAANEKFTRRFGEVERRLAQVGRKPEDATLAEMDALWDAAKADEKLDQKIEENG